jgi:hypothetical protein
MWFNFICGMLLILCPTVRTLNPIHVKGSSDNTRAATACVPLVVCLR